MRSPRRLGGVWWGRYHAANSYATNASTTTISNNKTVISDGGGGMSDMAALSVSRILLSHRHPLARQIYKVFAKLRIIFTERC